MARDGRKRTGRKILAGFVVLVILLVVVGVVLDRVAASVANRRVTTAVTDAAHQSNLDPTTVDVELGGFPFLTQLARGKFQGGRIALGDIATPVVRVDSVDLDVHDVTMPTDVLFGEPPHDIRASTIRGTATIAVTEVAKGLGVKGLTLQSQNNKLEAKMTVPIPTFGTVVLTGEVTPHVKANKFWLEVNSLRAGDVEVPPDALNAISNALARGFTLPLPFQIQLDGVRVSSGELLVNATARNVLLVR